MSRYKSEKFNFSDMSERITFLEQQYDGSFTNGLTVWAHALKDGFIRSETDNFYKFMIREQKAIYELLDVGNRIKWKKRMLSIHSWQDPSFEDRGFLEIMTKQIASPSEYSEVNGEIFKDVVSVYRMNKVETMKFGIISYEYKYDFSTPDYQNIRCHFSTDRNQYVYDKKTDVEHDGLIVKFSADAPIKIEDYIESPVHGRFKVDMVVKTDENMLHALVQRSEVQ